MPPHDEVREEVLKNEQFSVRLIVAEAIEIRYRTEQEQERIKQEDKDRDKDMFPIHDATRVV